MASKGENISRKAEADRFDYIAQLNLLLGDRFNVLIDLVVDYGYNHNNVLTKLYIRNMVGDFVKDIEAKLLQGAGAAQEISLLKNQALADTITSGFKVTIGDISKPDIDLNQAVFKPLSAALEAGVQQGLTKRKKVADVARELKQYVKNADSVPLKTGFKPGQGNSRSIAKNLKRKVSQVINTSFREADLNSWQNMPMVLGIEVNLSASHPRFDMCDHLAGRYPATFVFSGWHVYCLCFTVPILMTKEQFINYQALVIAGKDTNEAVLAVAERVYQIPATAAVWVNDNLDKLNKLKTTPYWLRDNKGSFKIEGRIKEAS